jgi:hypothetical protein
MKRGIYLVANYKSQEMCENLVFSIRKSGCSLPIRLIHFGGKEINSTYLLEEVEFLHYERFPDDARQFIKNLQSVLTDCPQGFLYRYLAWFSDWDEFLYSDNDIVALCNWEDLFDHLDEFDLVHADEEYTTKGKFNYDKPELVKIAFGEFALESAITAGHIVVKKNNKMIEDIYKAIDWFKKNPHIPKKHDQALLHIASLLGKWEMLNLCKPPFNWLSSWAGDYGNTLEIIQKIQTKATNISHLHYSGGEPKGNLAIQDLLFSTKDDKKRLLKLSFIGLKSLSGYDRLRQQYLKIIRYINRKLVRN